MNVEQEDVCPVVTLPAEATIDDFLGTLGKKERHEIRRKVRRAEAAGEVRLDDSTDPDRRPAAPSSTSTSAAGAPTACSRTTPAATRAAAFVRRMFETARRRRPAPPRVPHGRRPPDRGRARRSRPPTSILYYNAGVDPDARDLSPGVLMVERVHPARARARAARGSTSCAATSPTSTSGARSTSRSSGCSSGGRRPDDAHRRLQPVPRAVRRRAAAGDRRRMRVVEVLATGTNGGAQEHLYNLVSRMDRERYDVSVVSLSPGSAVRKLERLGIPVTVIDEPDDAIATGILAAHLARRPAPRSSTTTCTGPRSWAPRPRSPWARPGIGGRG